MSPVRDPRAACPRPRAERLSWSEFWRLVGVALFCAALMALAVFC